MDVVRIHAMTNAYVANRLFADDDDQSPAPLQSILIPPE